MFFLFCFLLYISLPALAIFLPKIFYFYLKLSISCYFLFLFLFFYFFYLKLSISWSNDLVVKVLDSQSRGTVFKTTGWLQGHPSKVDKNEDQEFLGTCGKK